MIFKQILSKNISTLKINQISSVHSILIANNNQKRNASSFKFVPETAPASLGETTKMNLYQSVTNALDISLSSEKSAGIYYYLCKQKFLFLFFILIISGIR